MTTRAGVFVAAANQFVHDLGGVRFIVETVDRYQNNDDIACCCAL